MSIHLKTPVHGLAAGLPRVWYDIFEPITGTFTRPTCPTQMAIWITFGASSVVAPSVNFAGRGRTCSFVDSYVGFAGVPPYVDFATTVDVWSAYAAAVWTSSATIDVIWGGATAVAGVVHATRWNDRALLAAEVTKAVTRDAGSPSCAAATVKATITVNDNGTYTIA